jgi:hypothetical protein
MQLTISLIEDPTITIILIGTVTALYHTQIAPGFLGPIMIDQEIKIVIVGGVDNRGK